MRLHACPGERRLWQEHPGALAPSGQGAKSTSTRLEGGALYFFLSLEGAALPLSSTASFALSAAA